jgi:hypothetical protein
MTDSEKQVHLNNRRRRMEAILANIQGFKVCETCRSISKKEVGLCCICHAYRWEESPDYIKEIAEIIGSTPFPLTAGTVPRLDTGGHSFKIPFAAEKRL